MVIPTQLQIRNAYFMGWVYLGDGLFTRDELLGYFTETGFIKEDS